MARTRHSRTTHAGWSAISGRIRVVDFRRERRLIVGGAILSAYPLDGDWSTIEREYWWQGVSTVRFPPRPRVLLVGLGGGTQAHLVHRLTTPRLITAIERDEVTISYLSRIVAEPRSDLAAVDAALADLITGLPSTLPR